MLPVSLQVLDAGEGGGGISRRSAFSLLLVVDDNPGKADAEVEAAFVVRSDVWPLLDDGVVVRILNLQTSIKFHAEF